MAKRASTSNGTIKLVIVFVAITTTACGEPLCSKFDYDEKVLGKIMRVEFKVETFVEEVKSKQGHVLAELAKTQDTTTNQLQLIEKERENMRTMFATLKDKLTNELTSKTEEIENAFRQQEKQVLRMSKDLREQENATLEKIKDAIVTPTVVFKARHVTDLSPSVGDTIVFTSYLSNEGQGYDNTTGVFTAPVTGVYLLTIQLCTKGGAEMHFSIVIDGDSKAKGKLFYGDHYGCGSADAVAAMTSGMKAWVIRSAGSSGKILHQSIDRWNTFSGFLVHR